MSFVFIDPFDSFDDMVITDDQTFSKLSLRTIITGGTFSDGSVHIVPSTSGPGKMLKFVNIRSETSRTPQARIYYTIPNTTEISSAEKVVIGMSVSISSPNGSPVSVEIFSNGAFSSNESVDVNVDGSISYGSTSSSPGVFNFSTENYITYEIDYVAKTISVYVDDNPVAVLSTPLSSTGQSQTSRLVSIGSVRKFPFDEDIDPTHEIHVTYDHLYVRAFDGPFPPFLGKMEVVKLPAIAATETGFITSGGSNLSVVNSTSGLTEITNRSDKIYRNRDLYSIDASPLGGINATAISLSSLSYYNAGVNKEIKMIAKQGENISLQDAATDFIQMFDPPAWGQTPQFVIEEVPGGGTLSPANVGSMEFGYGSHFE